MLDTFEAYHLGRAHVSCVALEVLFKHMKTADPATFEKIKEETLSIVSDRLPSPEAIAPGMDQRDAEMLRDRTMEVARGLFEE